MGKGFGVQLRGKETKSSKRKKRSGGSTLAALAVCQHGFLCQYCTAPRHGTGASWLWPWPYTHKHIQVQTLSFSLLHTVWTHLAERLLGHGTNQSPPFPFFFLFFCRPSIIHPSVPPHLCSCVCVCHYSYVAGGGGGSSGQVWPIHWKEDCPHRQEPWPLPDLCPSSRPRTQNLQNWWDAQEGNHLARCVVTLYFIHTCS